MIRPDMLFYWFNFVAISPNSRDKTQGATRLPEMIRGSLLGIAIDKTAAPRRAGKTTRKGYFFIIETDARLIHLVNLYLAERLTVLRHDNHHIIQNRIDIGVVVAVISTGGDVVDRLADCTRIHGQGVSGHIRVRPDAEAADVRRDPAAAGVPVTGIIAQRNPHITRGGNPSQ